MNSSAWPMMLDFTRDESKRLLRRLELDAYAGVMTAFRAQGHLSAERQKILKELQSMLSISTERHRAEVRRAINDERLYTIADNMGCGSNVMEKWVAEGQRLVPLLPRLVPQTAFMATANDAANAQADKNLLMRAPYKTGSRDREAIPPSTTHMQTVTTSITPPVYSRSSMANFSLSTSGHALSTGGPSAHVPSSAPTGTGGGDVVVLPNGMSIHIKGGLNSEEDGHPASRHHHHHHRRSSSTESLLLNRPLPHHHPPHPNIPPTTRLPRPPNPNTIQGIAPLKISVTKSQTKTSGSGPNTTQQKVIIVSNAGTWPTPHKYVVSKSAMGTVATPSGGGGSLISSSGQVSQRPASLLVSKTAHVADAILSPSNYVTYSATKLKPSTVSAVQKGLPTSRGTMVIPVSSQTSSSSAQSFQNIHIKPAAGKPPIHIKQEGSMKIITQGLPTSLSTASKILPKPAGCPIVVDTTAPSVSKPMKTANLIGNTGSTTNTLNLSAGAQRVVSSASIKQTSAANIVTVNPKKLQFATIKSGTGTTVLPSGTRLPTSSALKPNLKIVVQKPAGKKGGQQLLLKTPTSTVSSAFEKELVSFIQKQDSHHKQLVVPQRGVLKHMAEASKKLPTTPVLYRPPAAVVARPSDLINPTISTQPSSSLLAELIHAAGIGPPSQGAGRGVGEPGMSEVNQAVSDMVADVQSEEVEVGVGMDKDAQSETNVWLEYDIQQTEEEVVSELMPTSQVVPTSFTTDHSGPQVLDTAAIKAMLQMASSSSQGNVTTSEQNKTRSRPVDLNQVSTQLQSTQSQVYVVDESGHLVVSDDIDKLPANLTSGVIQQYVQSIAASKTSKTFHNVPTGVISVEVSTATTTTSTTTTSSQLDPQTGVLQSQSSLTVPSPHVSIIPMTGIPTSTQVAVAEIHDKFPAPKSVISRVLELPHSCESVDSPVGGGAKSVELAATAMPSRTLVSILVPPSSGVLTSRALMSVVGGGVQQGVQMAATVRDTLVDSFNAGQHESATYSHLDTVKQKLSFAPPDTVLVDRVASDVTKYTISATPPAATTISSCSRVIKSTMNPRRPPQISHPHASPSVVVMTSIAQTDTSSIAALSNEGRVTVTVQPQALDTAHMQMEDFTSQRIYADSAIPGDYGEVVVSTTSMAVAHSSSDSVLADAAVRLGKRKHNLPSPRDDASTTWIKSALSLLQKVSKYRGVNKEKGMRNAAAWFTRPVSPKVVPDYYQIIHRPMDFSTVRKKLELRRYRGWDDFHEDMLLVQQNCHQYNPPGSEVRIDCDEVFSFYADEYEKANAGGVHSTGATTETIMVPSPHKFHKLDDS